MSIPVSSSQNPSLRWLNTLVVVTLITVTVAITYLGYYYVGAGNRSQVTWFAPELDCRPLNGPCFTALGRFGEMQAQWHYQKGQLPMQKAPLHMQKGQLRMEMMLDGLNAEQVTMQLESTGHRLSHAARTLEPVSPGHYRGTFDISLCDGDARRTRASLVVTTSRGILGSWYDLSLPCR